MDDEPLLGAEELVRDHERPDRIVAGAAAGVADHVRITPLSPAYLAGSSRASMQVRIAKRRAGGRQARPWRRTTLSLRRGTCLNVPPARIHSRAGIGPLGDGVRRLSFGDQHAPECLNRKHSHRLSRCARSATDVRREDDLIE